MQKKSDYRLTHPFTIIIVLLLWCLPIIPIIISISRKGNVDIIVLSSFTILFTPFLIVALYNRLIIIGDNVILKNFFGENATTYIAGI